MDVDVHVVLVQQHRVVGRAAGVLVVAPALHAIGCAVQIRRSKMTVATSRRSACATAHIATCQPRRRALGGDRPEEHVDRPALVVRRPLDVPGA